MQTSSEKQINLGLLLVRLGIAASLLIFSIPKLMGGDSSWTQTVSKIKFLPDGTPLKWVGLTLLLFQVLGSLGMITGGFFRLSAVLLTTAYTFYFINYLTIGYKILPPYAAALAFTCIGLMFIGPGRFSVALKIEKK